MRQIISPLSGIRSPFGLRSSASPAAAWLLLSGVWNDSGLWADTATWNDGA